MSSRPYRKQRRAEAQAGMRERILRATAALHAEHGATGTSYAMIAAKAGVSPQTVYNHFPTLGTLIQGCTGHVGAQAPPLDAAVFAQGRSAGERLRLLAAAVYAQLDFLAPWLRLGWGEAEMIPELRALFDGSQAQLRQLLAQAAGPQHRPPPEFLDAALLLLDYPAWKGLRRRRSQARAAALAGECLVALHAALCQAPREATP